MNTEMNNEINTPIVVAGYAGTEKVKVFRDKKTATPAPKKSAAKLVEIVEDEWELSAFNIAEEDAVVDAVVVAEEQELQEDTISDAGSNNSASAEEDVDEELAEQMEIIKAAMERTKHLSIKKKLIQHSGEFLEKLKVSKNKELEKLNDEILRLKSLKEKVEEEVETLDGINVDEDDVMGFLSENYADFVNKLAFPKEETGRKPTVAKKASAKSDSETEKKTIAKYDRKTQFAEMPTGLELIISYKGEKATYEKTDAGLKRGEDEYETLHQAGKAFYASIGLGKKSFNAWSEFKTIVDGKKIAIADL